jgi:dihydroxyacid dehydratase/phosphogluconate dehydratase
MLAVGGPTTVVIHRLAIIARAGVDLDLDRFDELSRRTPLRADVRPSGRGPFEDVFHAGGIPALMMELGPLLAREAMTIGGHKVGEASPG